MVFNDYAKLLGVIVLTDIPIRCLIELLLE